MDINILDLPLEILVNVCEQLVELKDKKNFARAHPQLWDAFAYQNRNRVRSVFCCFEDSELFEICDNWEFILEWWGPNITEIIDIPLSVDVGELIETLGKFCPNLEIFSFSISGEDIIERVLENLPKFRGLRDIRIIDSIYDHSSIQHPFYAKLFQAMQGLTNLRSLKFNFLSLDNNDSK